MVIIIASKVQTIHKTENHKINMITETQNKDVQVYLYQGTGNSKLFLTHPVGKKLKFDRHWLKMLVGHSNKVNASKQIKLIP